MRPAVLVTYAGPFLTPPRLLAVLVAALLAFGPSSLTQPRSARAATVLGTTTYSSNTTWTSAGSPYILNGNVTVSAGATLTVQPGVVVKFNGQTRTLTVNGTLAAVGTSGSPITFTSYQDDSVGGDSNGDGGATSGAAGQWQEIRINSLNSSSELKWVAVKFGAYTISPGNSSQGAVEVTGAATTLTIGDATFTSNLRSALKVGTGSGSYPGATVKRSTFSQNGSGISVNQGWVQVSGETVISN